MTWMWTSSCPHFIMTSESWCSNKEGLPYHDLLKLLSGNRTSHLWNQCLWFLISDLISSLQPMRDFDFIVFFPEYVIYTNPVRCSKRTTLALCFPCYFSITILRLFLNHCFVLVMRQSLFLINHMLLKASEADTLVCWQYETCSWLKLTCSLKSN